MKKVEAQEQAVSPPLVRGKYANLLARGSNVAIIDADIMHHFPDSEAVNHALRAFLAFGQEFQAIATPRRRPQKATPPAKRARVFDPRNGGQTERVLSSEKIA